MSKTGQAEFHSRYHASILFEKRKARQADELTGAPVVTTGGSLVADDDDQERPAEAHED